MQLSDAPSKIVLPFASSGAKNVIPVTTSGVPGSASFTGGFPAETMLPVTSGGVPPAGKDFNGIYFDLSAVDRWACAGAGFPWDSAFSTAVGGYPKGARVFNASGVGYWLCVADNNTTNPDAAGAGWVTEGGSNAIASVYALGTQVCGTGISKVIFDHVEFDPAGLWDNTNHRFVATLAGPYRISGSVELQAPGAQALASLIYKNGTVWKLCDQFPQVSDVNLSLTFDAIVQLAVGDYLEAFLSIPTTAVTVGQGGSNQPYVYLQIEVLGQ